MKAVTVVVRLAGGSQDLRSLVASLDGQTAATDDFDVVWALEPNVAVPDQVEAWLGLRPHHRLAAGGLGAALVEGEGTYLLVVGSGDRLYPDALECLSAFAETNALDAVMARTCAPGAPVPPYLAQNATGLHKLPPVVAGPGEPLLLVRRELAVVDADDHLLAPASGSYGVLASVPVLRRPGAAAPDAPLPTLRAGWDGAELVLEVDLDGLVGPLTGLLEHRDDARSYLLPVEAGLTDPRTAVVRFAPLDLPGIEAPLDPGWWRLALQGTAAGTAAVRPVGWRACPPALVETTGLVPFADSGAWALDVGPTRQRLIVVDDPDAGTVRETPYGSRLVVSLPALHTAKAETLRGSLTLGPYTLPARIMVEGTGARLEALATGVGGVKPIGVRFGPGGTHPLGLSLEISGTGQMSLARTAEPSTSAPPVPVPQPPRDGRRKPPPRRGLLAAARRRVPRSVEPFARRAARWGPARRLYCRFTH